MKGCTLIALSACIAVCSVTSALPAQSEQYVVAAANDDVQQAAPPSSLTKKILSSALQPYAAFLFFREGLTDEDMSSTSTCNHDQDCESASFCGDSGVCLRSLAVKARCSRDAMCASDYCHAGRMSGVSRCAAKRTLWASCSASPASACAEGLFCSTTDLRCHAKRGLGQTCRSDQACAEGLACVNYQCHESVKPSTTIKDPAAAALESLRKRRLGPQPSGSWQQPHWFAARREGESDAEYEKRTFWPQPSGSWQQPHWFAVKRDGESDEEHAKRTFWPQPSGSWQQPHWFAVKRDGETDEERAKRTFWPQPSGSWQQPHWFAVKREEEGGPPNAPVMLKRVDGDA